jgi:hypothetical protein
MLQAQGIIPKRRPSVTTNTYDRPSHLTNGPMKGEKRVRRRSIPKEPSIVRQCENAIQRDEVTRLRVRDPDRCLESSASDSFRSFWHVQKQVKELQRRLRETEKVKREDIKPVTHPIPEVIDLTQ